ncbi:MAG: MBL fold metallo-hydrolase [bacterium]
MEITWWGTAGFRIKTGRTVFLIDPYLSRNPAAEPVQYLRPEKIREGEQIFLSHGHFDHIQDVPVIAGNSDAIVYCSRLAADTLIGKGLKRKQIRVVDTDGFSVDFDDYHAQAFFSQHVKFDRWLVLKTLARINVRLLHYLPMLRDYPQGQVLSWRFVIEDKILHFFGSGGSPADELERLACKETDILLIPLQGHTNICEIALEYVQVMQPKIVIPHHQDNFYPPISTTVDIDPLIDGIRRECPRTDIRVMGINESIIV